MNEKEIGELRRRVRRDRSNITAIYGCYVNSQKEIVSEFRLGTGTMPENEAEKYFGTLKRVLSGGLGRNLIDITFRTAQVADSPEHSLLMQLRQSKLGDDEARMRFYTKAIESLTLDDSYVILLGCDSYDVPFKSGDGAHQADASDETFVYLLCAVCPVKLSKSTLQYSAQDRQFHDAGVHNEMSAPELGFLFPAFDNRATNIYSALYYTRSTKESHKPFVDAVFNTAIPQPAAEQKKSFEALLTAALEESDGLEPVQNVHDRLRQAVQLHKESRVADPLLISKQELRQALEDSGVPEKQVARFSVDYDETFGCDAQLHPKNIVNTKRFELQTPDVTVTVNPERSDLIETRIIGGVKYILICADENIEVNGVNINIKP